MTQFVLDRKKRPAEKFQIGVDFTSDVTDSLGAVDAPASHTITAVDQSGADVTGTVVAAPVLGGNVSRCTCLAGADGMTYTFWFTVTTAGGMIYQHSVVVAAAVAS